MPTDIDNSGLPVGWEKSETVNDIPYYLNHNDEVTQWDHPALSTLFQNFESLNEVHYGAYRIAKKIRLLQVLSNMYLISSQDIVSACKLLNMTTVKESLGVSDIEILLRKLFNNIQQELSIELTLNMILKCCDIGRTGCLNIGAVIVVLLVLSRGTPYEKYRAMFSVFAAGDGNTISRLDVHGVITTIVSITECVGETQCTSFSSVNIPGTLATLETENQSLVTESEFLHWIKMGPQVIAWLPTLSRLVLAETVKHEAKCALCKAYPIVGIRFRCLKCLNTDLCENCFLTNKESRKHKFYHPTKEYCLATKSSDDVKDFAIQIKNKFRRSFGVRNVASQMIPLPTDQVPIQTQQMCDLSEAHCHIKLLTDRLRNMEPPTLAIADGAIEENVHESATTSELAEEHMIHDDLLTENPPNYNVIQASTAELIDKGISVSTLEESGLGGEIETIQRLTERMEISLQHTLLEKKSTLLYLSHQVSCKGADFVNLMYVV